MYQASFGKKKKKNLSAMLSEATMCQNDSMAFLHYLTSNRKEKEKDNNFMYQIRTIMLKLEK